MDYHCVSCGEITAKKLTESSRDQYRLERWECKLGHVNRVCLDYGWPSWIELDGQTETRRTIRPPGT